MKSTILKPGLLVSLKTSLRGNVRYSRTDTEPEHATADGKVRAAWNTEKEIADPAELERGTTARTEARAAVARECAYSPNFGFLCPSAKEEALASAIEDARRIAAEFNAGARMTRLQVSIITGRIADNDVEAARAIGAEIRELLDAMREGIRAADPEKIREAATKAKNLGSMLSADVAGQVSAAIVEARAAAKEITKRVAKAGETAAQVVSECSTARIDGARFAFLDLEEPDGAELDPEAPPARGIDLEPAPAAEAYAAPVSAPALELF